MLLLENKYDLFKKITYDKKLSDYEKELNSLKTKLEEDIKNYEEDLKEKNRKTLLKDKHKIDVKKNEEVQVIKNKARESILKLREELVDDLSNELINKYKEYVKTDDYINTLKKELKEFSENKDNEIYVIQRDLDKIDDDFRYKILDEKYIGGFIVENKKNNTLVDNTIVEFVKDDRNTIGLIVQDFINRVGVKVE